MDKKNILKLILIFTIAIISITAYIFYDVNKIIKDLDKDEELSEQVSNDIKQMFLNKNIFDYSICPSHSLNFSKYIVLTSAYYEANDGNYYSFNYDNSINEKLKTHTYLTDDYLDGIVFLNLGVKNFGSYYRKGSIFSEEKETSEKAIQKYYTVNFIDLKTKCIIKRDTIFGPLPKKSKSSNENQGSTSPTDDQIASKINEMIEW